MLKQMVYVISRIS